MSVSDTESSLLFSNIEGLEMRTTPNSGRGLFAKKSFKRNQLIFQCIPAIHTLESTVIGIYSDYRGNCCANCHTRKRPTYSRGGNDSPASAELSRCESCGVQFYCSDECMEEDLPVHGFECKLFQSFTEKFFEPVPETLVRSVLRTLIKRRFDYRFNKQCELMCTHSGVIDQNELFRAESQLVADYLTPVTMWSSDQIKTVCHMLFINSTILFNEFAETIGQMFDPTLALFNHSCFPNADLFFQKQIIKVFTVRDINPGDEVYINYSIKDLPKCLRIPDLSARYFFHCECSRCTQEFDDMETIRCYTCNDLIWNYSIERYINNRNPPKTEFDKKCCQLNYARVRVAQLCLYSILVGVLDREDDSSVMEALNDEMFSDRLARSKQIRQLWKITNSILEGPPVLPVTSYPLYQALLGLQRLALRNDGLDRLLYTYLVDFKTTNGIIYSEANAMYNFLTCMDAICQKLSVFDGMKEDFKTVYHMLLGSVTICCLQKLLKIFDEDSLIVKRCCTIGYNMKVRGCMEPLDGSLNTVLDVFARMLFEEDKRFQHFKAEKFYIDENPANPQNGLSLVDYIKHP